MKLALATLTSMILAGAAHADSLRTSQLEILPKVTVDGKETAYTGRLQLDFVQNKISLEVLDDKCHTLTSKPGMITCLAMPQEVTLIEVPLDKKSSDGCGTAHYSGKIDQSPVDGPRKEVEIEDNTKRGCENVIPYLIGVKAKVLVPMTGKETLYELSR